MPVGADRVHHRQTVRASGSEVVGTERGGQVHQARAVVGGDVVGQHDEVGVLERDEVERPLVGPALHVATGVGGEHLGAVTHRLVQQGLCDDERAGLAARDDVVDVRVDRDRGVGHERPRRRRPDEQVRLARPRARRQGEADVDRRVGDVLVALRDLVVGQPGAAARAVRRDAVVLDEQALVEDLLERPPHRLDVVAVHRPVGVVVVGPVAHPLAHRFERVDVALDVLAALRVELGDSVGLDVGLAGEPEFLLDCEFDGQAVAVPAGYPRDVVALHRLEPRKDVLEDARLDVVGTGHAVRGGRPLVERPGRAVRGLLQAAGEDPVCAPVVDDLAVEFREVDVRGQRLVAARLCRVGHGWCSFESVGLEGRRPAW